MPYFFIKGGRKPLPNSNILAINRHMESMSSIAANRYLKKNKINAFYCSTSLVEAYSKFDLELSFSTFYKYVDDYFKKPHRLSDLCEYCEHYKTLKKGMLSFLGTKNFTGNTDHLDEIKIFIDNLLAISKISL
jgi:hypothetical protein